MSFQDNFGRGGLSAAAWVLYQLIALRIASERRCSAFPICWHSLYPESKYGNSKI